MKRLLALAMTLLLTFSVTACAGNEKNEIRLGTSDFSVILPEGYEKTDDDYDEDQVAYYYKDDDSVDFDVYQWAKEGTYTLESEAEYFASEYGTAPESVVINDIDCKKYISSEEYDGYTYTVINYMFDDDESIVELCFWTIGTEEEYAVVDEIIGTLKKN